MSEKRNILITGGTSGIGRAIVEHFARKGERVLFTGRNADKAQELITAYPQAELHFVPADFASFESIVNATETIRKLVPQLDVLINNAGVWEMEFKETADGIERNFAVNHLAPMLFTLRLLPLINPQNGRIINTSSGAHRRNILDLNDIEWRNKIYDGVATYSQSKLCNILFTRKLADQVANTGILVNTVHPGYVQTDLFNNMGQRNWEGVAKAADGARSAIFAAEDNTLVNQSKLYLYHEKIDPNITALAQNDQVANELWELSLKYINAFLNH